MKSAEEIRPDMTRLCTDVCEALGISEPAACVLLRNFKWSKEALMGQFFSDSEKILKSAGVYCRCGHEVPPPDTSNEMHTCQICFDDTNNMLAMPCGHSFCVDCWADFCENAVNEGPSCVLKTCPQAECKEVVTDEEFAQALGPSSPILQKFKSFQLRSFVESNPLFRWCPGRGCERIAAAMSYSIMESEGSVAQCDSCDAKFCLVCAEEPHAPSTCKGLAKWLEKCKNESETANWILANVRITT